MKKVLLLLAACCALALPSQSQTRKVSGTVVSAENGAAVAGASIGYRTSSTDGRMPDRWEVCTGPFDLPQGRRVEAVAHRIGYLPSRISVWE